MSTIASLTPKPVLCQVTSYRMLRIWHQKGKTQTSETANKLQPAHHEGTREKPSICTFPGARKLTALILGADALGGTWKGPVRDSHHHEEGQRSATIMYVTSCSLPD